LSAEATRAAVCATISPAVGSTIRAAVSSAVGSTIRAAVSSAIGTTVSAAVSYAWDAFSAAVCWTLSPCAAVRATVGAAVTADT
jgi:hypothetical protein